MIILDFTGVPTIGQAFADEIFRVFAKEHPELTIHAIHANSEVNRMILRARTSSYATLNANRSIAAAATLVRPDEETTDK
jgi:hypothetical protein